MKRLITVIAIALAIYIMMAFIGIPAGEEEPVESAGHAPRALNILAILPLSGDDMDLGASQQYGISRGTIQPRDQPINLHIEDSRGDPDHAVAILRERRNTIAIHALIISGSDCVLATAPYAEEWGIPIASIAAPIQPGVERSRSRISFTPPIATEIDAIAPFISDYSDIAFIYPDTGEGREMAEQIRSIPNLRNLRLIEYTQEQKEYSDLMRPLRVNPPEIFIIYGKTQVPAIISAIRSRGEHPIILVWERGSVILLEEAPDLAEGVFVLAPVTNAAHPVFSGMDEQPFSMAPGIVAESFDAAHTLSTSITTCGGDMECIAGWFWNRSHLGALGTIRFNEKREAGYQYEIRQIRRGESETVGMITAPSKIVYIRVITGSGEGWFVDEVKKGADTALTMINEETNIELPLATSTGIPSLFDARVGVLYDFEAIPKGAEIIGTITTTPDGKTSISGGGADPERVIGIDNEAYISLCYDILDEKQNADGKKRSIVLFSSQPDDPLIGIVRTTAESRGYQIGADSIYENSTGIGSAIDSIMRESPDTPLFVSASSPDEAILIQSYIRRAEYSPEMIFTLGDAWKSASFIRGAGIFSEGIIAGSVYKRESINQFQAIRGVNTLMVRQTGQETNDITARAFTGIMMIADGAERADNRDPSTIHTAILTAPMKPEYGALYDGGTHIIQMRNGVYRTIL